MNIPITLPSQDNGFFYNNKKKRGRDDDCNSSFFRLFHEGYEDQRSEFKTIEYLDETWLVLRVG